MKLNPFVLALSMASMVGLSSCETVKQHVNGDSSMRIQVDVYKGPLALDPEMQWGRLLGYQQEAHTAINHMIKSTMEYAREFDRGTIFVDKTNGQMKLMSPDMVCNNLDAYSKIPVEKLLDQTKKNFETAKSNRDLIKKNEWKERGLASAFFWSPARSEAEANYNVTKRAHDGVKYADKKYGYHRRILEMLLADACDAQKFISSTNLAAAGWSQNYNEFRQKFTEAFKSSSKHFSGFAENEFQDFKSDAGSRKRDLQGILARFSEVGARLQTKAGYWTWHHANVAQDDITLRQTILGFALIYSEYANRVVSAADALLKQTYYADRRQLPISELIRDTSPTHVASQLIFNGAMSARLSHEDPTSEYRYDRFRVIEQVYDDESWSNINQAYASGRGETAQVFVKDDIGNWNLKSFDQDPTELVQAYKKMSSAAIKAATTIATSGTSEAVSRSQRLLALANQVSSGKDPGASQVQKDQLEILRKSSVLQLEALKTSTAQTKPILEEQLQALTTVIEGDQKGSKTYADQAFSDYEDLFAPGADGTDNSVLKAEKRAEWEAASLAYNQNIARQAQLKSQLHSLSQTTAQEALAILSNYAQVLTSMQQAIAEP